MFFPVLIGLTLIVALYVAVQVYIRKAIVERADRYSFATNPGRVKPNKWLLRPLAPGLYPYSFKWEMHRNMLRIRIFIARQLWMGASNPAVVMQENPLIIAAYAADCDAVLLVRFLPETIAEAKARGIVLRTGARLLSINTYFPDGEEWKKDEVVRGPLNTGLWRSFRPYIAEFMCDNSQLETIHSKQREISPQLWERTQQLGAEKLRDSDLDAVRWGNPMYVEVPGSYNRAIAYAKHWEMDY